MNKKNLPQTYYLSYECGFVCQTAFELTPEAYLDFIILLIPFLNAPLKTKVQVETLILENRKLTCQFDNQKNLAIDTNPYTLKETTWGGGAFNNCLNEAVIGEALRTCGYPVTLPTEFPLISDNDLFFKIQTSISKNYPGLHFTQIDGTPRQAVIFSCPSIQDCLIQHLKTPNKNIESKAKTLKELGLDITNLHIIQDTFPKSINIHNRIPKQVHHIPYCPQDPDGFYPINNHLPNESFEYLESLEKSAEIEFRIGSTQITQLCQYELPTFKGKYPHLKPCDATINRIEFPTLWLMQKAKRVCLNLSEAQEILEHEQDYKFLPRPIKKETLLSRFVEDFGIQTAVISDGAHPLNIVSNDFVKSVITLQHYTLSIIQTERIKKIFIQHNLVSLENETGCGDSLVVGLELGRRLRDLYFPQKTDDFIAEFGLTISTTKFLWKESNFGSIPKEILHDIISSYLSNS